jgi:hypothetical protein
LALYSTGPILVARFSEHGDGEFAPPIVTAFDVIADAGRNVEIFFDMGKMVNYDSALRTRLTSHFLEHRPKIASLHVFTRSRIVSMGVSVANLALGNLITSHSDVGRFMKALDDTAHKHRASGISGSLLSGS